MIVGVSGYAGSGKDAVGRILVECFGFERRSFADGVKRVAREIGWDGAKDVSGRVLLQALGAAVRHVDAEVWVRPVFRDLPQKMVVTDVRYPNEASAIWRAGGQVWRVERPGVGPANGHETEVSLDGFPFDRFISNHLDLNHLAVEVHRAIGG